MLSRALIDCYIEVNVENKVCALSFIEIDSYNTFE